MSNNEALAVIQEIRSKFLSYTGLSSVEMKTEDTGPETFLQFRVGRDAPLYWKALTRIRQELPDEHPFHGRVILDVEKGSTFIASCEEDLLRTLIQNSLRTTRDSTSEQMKVDFVPFRGNPQHQVVQNSNHVIAGRRGVGKSSLILLAYRELKSRGDLPIWIDLQPFHGRADRGTILDVLSRVLDELAELEVGENLSTLDKRLKECRAQFSDYAVKTPTEIQMRKIVSPVQRLLKDITHAMDKKIFLFLDDAHLIARELQPKLFDFFHSLLKGGGGWLKIAGVQNLLRVYETASKTGLQIPHDALNLSLDFTLVDPGAARRHLIAILDTFLGLCGIRRFNSIISEAAIDRLVWCAAGVPRDFLHLFERSIAFAHENRKKRVGVQAVNLAVGEFGEVKMAEVEEDMPKDGTSLVQPLESLKAEVLGRYKSNSFLVRHKQDHEGYRTLQKLVDLRLVHLLNSGITPSKSGERFQAYLLDYSFYTGLRKRSGLTELHFNTDEPPKYATLRKLPKVDLDKIA